MSNIFAIGDVHGCCDQLENLLAILPVDYKNDTLVFLGDYIDRGQKSREVIETVLDLKTKVKEIHCLMGNHEVMLLDYLAKKPEGVMFLANGGINTLVSYQDYDSNEAVIPEKHMNFLNSLEWIYETDEYIFVHAGLRPGIKKEDQTNHDLVWIRNEFISSSNEFGKTIIFGHTPFAQPLVSDNKIGIDTGCVYGNMLTAIQLPQMNFYSV